jgi:YVTN family beta-propeller protein
MNNTLLKGNSSCPVTANTLAPTGGAFDSTNGDIYLNTWYDEQPANTSVLVINGSDNKITTTIPVPIWPAEAAFDNLSGHIYVSDGLNEVSDINGSTNRISTNISVGSSSLRGLAYDSSNGDLYVANDLGGGVSVVNSSTDTVVSTINTGGYPIDVAFDSTNGDIYVSNNAGGVNVIDGSTNKVIQTISTKALPIGDAFDSSNGNIYVANATLNAVGVIDGSTNKFVGNISVGADPVGMTYDSANGYLYVANWFSDNLSVIDGANNKLIGSISVGDHPRGGEFDSTNGYIYESNYGTGTAMGNRGTGQSVSVIAPGIPPPPTYNVSFSQAGLPAGTSWSVTLNGTANSSTTNTIGFTDPNGSYAYVVGNVAGYAPTPPTGQVNVIGTNVTVSVTFNRLASLSSVTISPHNSTLTFGGTQPFSATATCPPSPCPDSVNYTWSMSNGLGSLLPATGPNTTFTAGFTPGNVTITVTSMLNGKTVTNTSVATISSPTPILSAVSLTPSIVSLPESGIVTFNASPTCANSTCPAGIGYSWTLNNTLGSIGDGSGSATTFTAGKTLGEVMLTVNATLNGKSVSDHASITITGSTQHMGPPKSTFLGLPGYDGYILVLIIVVAAIVIALTILIRRRKQNGSPPPPKTEENESPESWS